MAVLLVSFWWDIAILCGLLLVSLYAWAKHCFKYWERKKVPGPAPHLLAGNIAGIFTKTRNFGETFYDLYNMTKSQAYSGVYMMQRPTLLINSLDVIKTVLVKDFVHFSDHWPAPDEKYEPISAHLFNAEGEKWKNLRSKLTPTFTSSRIKNMFGTVRDCAVAMELYLEEHPEQWAAMDLKDLLAKLNTDVIGSCAFGVDCNSFKNPNSEFRKMGRRIFEGGVIRSTMEFMLFFVPKVRFFLRFSIFENDLNEFFYNLVKDTIEYREKNDVVRNDFLQLLIQLKNKGSLDDDTGEFQQH